MSADESLNIIRLIISGIITIIALLIGFRMVYHYHIFRAKDSILTLIRAYFVFSLILYFIGCLTWITGITYITIINNSDDTTYDIITSIGWGCYAIFFNVLVWILWVRITYTFDNSVMETSKFWMRIIKIVIIISELSQIVAIFANIPSLNDPFGLTISYISIGIASLIVVIYAGLAIYFASKLFKLFNYAVQFNLNTNSVIEGISLNHINVVSKYVLCTIIQLISTIAMIVIYVLTLNTLFQLYFDIPLFMIDFIINELTIYLQLSFALSDYSVYCRICNRCCKKLIQKRIDERINTPNKLQTTMEMNTFDVDDNISNFTAS
mmetsp:Transcript_80866/g.99044  ORF Transcript_80866/g.99044 Transcript_80866/m.99044 type:complete len:323 (-) Transcript_80866:142-1110(-)